MCSTSRPDGISHVVAFPGTSVFEKFGLPASLQPRDQTGNGDLL